MDWCAAFKQQRRIEAEIESCDRQLVKARGQTRYLLVAERQALRAELECRKAQFHLMDKLERVAAIYEEYGRLGITLNNADEYLTDNASDWFEFIKTRDFLEPMFNPRVKRDLVDLENAVSRLERDYLNALETWARLQDSHDTSSS